MDTPEYQVIIYTASDDAMRICYPTGAIPIEEVFVKDIPEGTDARIVYKDSLPYEHYYLYAAWRMDADSVFIDMDRAKPIAHEIRRALREEEFKPYDEVIMKQIPGNSFTEAEAARQAIRDKYDTIQQQIDAAETPDDIKGALGI